MCSSCVAEALAGGGGEMLASRRWRGVSLVDREDALQQAALELLVGDERVLSATHARRLLWMRYEARLMDLSRARGGRSPDALHRVDVELDVRAHGGACESAEETVIAREALGRVLVAYAPYRARLLRPCEPATFARRVSRLRAVLRAAA